MVSASFVHLRVHSSYSLSEGAIKVEKIPALARETGMPAVAITDTANLFGALEFSQACAAKGVQPIIGCQIALARNLRSVLRLPRCGSDCQGGVRETGAVAARPAPTARQRTPPARPHDKAPSRSACWRTSAAPRRQRSGWSRSA